MVDKYQDLCSLYEFYTFLYSQMELRLKWRMPKLSTEKRTGMRMTPKALQADSTHQSQVI